MAQNITLQGASYPDVPSVLLPKTGGGTASFVDITDTTITGASDVLSGKIAHLADGTVVTGTATTGGGGASNIVKGSFTVGATTNTVASLTIPYTGSGFPIMLAIWIDGGVYNNATGGNTTWYNSTQRYAIGEFVLTKSQMTSQPTFGTSGAANQGVVAIIYKNSASTATTYSRTSSMTANSFSSSNATSSNVTTVRFKGNGKTLSYYVAGTSYGLLANQKYSYLALYSE